MIRSIIYAILFVYFGVIIGNCSQEIEISHNDSKYGGHFSEVVYNLNYKPHRLNAKHTKEKLGDKYYLNYHYGFNDYFAFSNYNKNTIFDKETLDLGVGYGWYLLNTKMWREKLSFAATFRGTQYITSIRLKTYLKAGIATFKNIFYYKPEAYEKTSDSDIGIKLSKRTSLGYKNSIEWIKDKSNFTNRLYMKVVF